MNGDPHSQSPLPPLSCQQIVYRAQLYKDWYKSGKVKKHAFMRMNKDADGVSVSLTVESCGEDLTDEFHGKLSLNVGRIRNLGLDVVADSPSHAVISGLPTRDENDALARTLAEDLANMARRVAE